MQPREKDLATPVLDFDEIPASGPFFPMLVSLGLHSLVSLCSRRVCWGERGNVHLGGPAHAREHMGLWTSTCVPGQSEPWGTSSSE